MDTYTEKVSYIIENVSPDVFLGAEFNPGVSTHARFMRRLGL